VLCRQIHSSLGQRSQRGNQHHSLVVSPLVVRAGFFVLLVVWLAYVYVSREVESRSRHRVCHRCFGSAAVGATLRHSSLGTYMVEGEGQAAGTLNNTAMLETLAQPVSSLVRLFITESQNAIRMCGWYLSTPTTVIRICAYYIFYKAGISCVLVLGMCRYHKGILDLGCFQVHISSHNHDMS
jgi:hypothetical protein